MTTGKNARPRTRKRRRLILTRSNILTPDFLCITYNVILLQHYKGRPVEIQNEIVVKLALDAAKAKAKTWLALSRELGVGRTTVYSWKYGKFYPNCEQFLNLLNYIEATEYLLEAIEKSSLATALLRPVCHSKARKDDVRK